MKNSSFFTLLKIKMLEREELDELHLNLFLAEKEDTLVREIVDYFKEWEEKKYPSQSTSLRDTLENEHN